ncbi:hypothetical protein [Marinobacter orientalis]|uniref:Uncharacterized protein n=1 Tax=Marinobacter orientalis TaxID=1928859 RepID=A0A7Y0WSG2_9GAMM|nr:hypothetical protein [Marinobacter orientalis]NMT63792.1 hypothetical protein [Marinobacter orientalis]TGX49901.1 hypothetical protein DIT72_09305 [Marinobacter orientalis]
MSPAHLKRKLELSSLSLSLIFSAFQVSAAPTIGSVNKIDEPTAEKGQIMRVQGSGFHDKKSGPAVLYDHGDIAWEGGNLNSHQADFEDMQLIQRIDADPQTLWAKPSLPDERNTGVLLAKSRDSRFGTEGSHYYASGNNNFLGWPTAHGGIEVDSNSKAMYAGFWMKIPFDPNYFYAIPADADSSGFIEGNEGQYGERIEVEGEAGYGRIISYEPDLGSLAHGWIFFEPPRGLETSLKGKKITGLTSKSVIVFPETPSLAKFDENGYITPGGKYARFWSDERGSGYRFSMGTAGVPGTGGALWANNFGNLSPTPGEWNFFEVALNVGDSTRGLKPSLRVSINGKTFVEGTEEWVENMLTATEEKGLYDESAVTIALLGIGDFRTIPFSFDLDDIYLDDTLQRVKVCSAPTIDAVRSGEGACELQHITKWDPSVIEFELYGGALNGTTTDLFLYVFDERGVPNSNGYPISGLFGSSPNSPVSVSIK